MLQLVIPAFNEEARLPGTLDDLDAHLRDGDVASPPTEVIVVDNASTDQTARVARAADRPSLPVRVVTCPERGKGAAVRAGVAATRADVVGYMDADGATGLDALDEGWRLLQQGAHVALASRVLAGRSRTVARDSALRSRGASFYSQLASRVVPGIADTQCGFKMMDGDLGRSVFRALRTTGFSFDVELLARARVQGASLVEFPARWVDVPGSTFSPARHGARAFADLGRISWHVWQVQAQRRRRARVRPSLTPPVFAPYESGAMASE